MSPAAWWRGRNCSSWGSCSCAFPSGALVAKGVGPTSEIRPSAESQQDFRHFYVYIVYVFHLLYTVAIMSRILAHASGGSTDATCEVWCKFVKSSRRSLKKQVFHLSWFCEFKVIAKWAWPTPHNLAVFREHVDIRFNNVQHIMWELWAKNSFTCKIAENSATCSWFLVCESQGPFNSTSMNFISISLMVWAQGQIWN